MEDGGEEGRMVSKSAEDAQSVAAQSEDEEREEEAARGQEEERGREEDREESERPPGTVSEFDTPLCPDGLVHATRETCDRILAVAAIKYHFARRELRKPLSLYAAIFWTVYFTVADPVLAGLTRAKTPLFHCWLTLYFRAFVNTRLPNGIHVYSFVRDVYAYVAQKIYLPQNASQGEP